MDDIDVDKLRALTAETDRLERAITADGWDQEAAGDAPWTAYNEKTITNIADIARRDPAQVQRIVAANRRLLKALADRDGIET